MNPSFRHWLTLLALVVGVLAADQISKRIVLATLRVGESVQILPLSPFFQITRSENTGSAFGFLPQLGDVFLVIAVVVVAVMLYLYPRIPDKVMLPRVATGLVCGGALGNALDRIQYGSVVDFIHYQIPGLFSNVSNLADHAIVLGVLLLFVDSWRSERAKSNKLKVREVEESAPESEAQRDDTVFS